MDEIQQFSVEEGLNQAMLMKLSFTHPSVHELRKLIPKQLGFKGNCRIGQLEHRHMLIRFDLYKDYVHVASRSIGYIHLMGTITSINYLHRLCYLILRRKPQELGFGFHCRGYRLIYLQKYHCFLLFLLLGSQ